MFPTTPVNFLNSALGSKAAPRYVIMTVASVGIIVGAITSSGMMEVARSGVFHPQMFTFAEVMLLFLAVMFTNGDSARPDSYAGHADVDEPFRSCSACWARR